MARHKKPFIPAEPTRSCGKNRYASKREADIVAEQQQLIFANSGLKLAAYHCSFCGGWHLTSKV